MASLLWLRLLKGAAPGLGWEGKYQTLREVKITILLYTDYIQTAHSENSRFWLFPEPPEEYKLESLGDSIFSKVKCERDCMCVCAHRHTRTRAL